jgi:hypothetical protein
VKVYVLHEHWEEECKIVGIFSTREKAQAEVDRLGGYFSWAIEEYELDCSDYAGLEYLPTWGVRMQLADGQLVKRNGEPIFDDHTALIRPGEAWIQELGWGACVVSPISREHAIASAEEYRRKRLAEREASAPSPG